MPVVAAPVIYAIFRIAFVAIVVAGLLLLLAQWPAPKG